MTDKNVEPATQPIELSERDLEGAAGGKAALPEATRPKPGAPIADPCEGGE